MTIIFIPFVLLFSFLHFLIHLEKRGRGFDVKFEVPGHILPIIAVCVIINTCMFISDMG